MQFDLHFFTQNPSLSVIKFFGVKCKSYMTWGRRGDG